MQISGRDAGFTVYSAAVTDSDGYYRMVVPAGNEYIWMDYQNENIIYWPREHYPDPGNYDVAVNEGETVTADFTFRPYTAFIEGRVTDEGIGVPNMNLTVTFTPVGGSSEVSETYTQEDGSYRVGVLPGNVSSLRIWDFNYNVLSPAGGSYNNFNIEEGEILSGKDFEVTKLIWNTITISGHVTFADGSVAENVYVIAAQEYSWNEDMEFIDYTDADGHFSFTAHWGGPWKVGVYHAGSTSTPPMYYYENLQGDVSIADADFVLSAPTGVESEGNGIEPKAFSLSQNVPNPYNPETTIRFHVKEPCRVRLKVYDALGREVSVLADKKYEIGHHKVLFNAQGLSSGLYLYTIHMGDFKAARKMLLLE